MKTPSASVFRKGFAIALALSLWTGTAQVFAQRAPKRETKGSFQKPSGTRPTFPNSHRPPSGLGNFRVNYGRPFTRINATTPRAELSRGYVSSANMYNGLPVRGYNGFHASYYWGAPHWYYWTPFHPAWYYSPPVYVNGYYQPGGFSVFRLLLSVALFALFIGLAVRLFGGGRGGSRYTTYN